MSNASNFQYTKKRAFKADQKVVDSTYTVRTGRQTDYLKFDNPVLFTDPVDNRTVTVPSGTYIGQPLFVVMTSNSNAKIISLSVTNHETSDPEVFTFDAADEMLELRWSGTEWVTIKATATT